MTDVRPPDARGLHCREGLWAFGLALLLCLLFFIPQLTNGFLEWADNAHTFLTAKVVMAARLRAGDYPLWTPLIGLGSPVGGDPSSGLFYPSVLLYMALPPLWAQSTDLLLHPALSLTFAFLYARRLGLSRPAAALAALTYGLSGFAVLDSSRQAMVNSLPWLPAVCLLLHDFRERGGGARLILAGLTLGLCVLAGHPQTTLYIWLALALHTVSLAAMTRQPRLLLSHALPFVIGIGIGALQASPALALQGELTRATMTAAQRALGTLRPDIIPQLVVPNRGFEPFLGLVAVVLAVIALCHARRLSTHLRAWVPVAAAAFVLMMGQYTPLEPSLSRLPGFDILRFPSRHVVYLALAVGLLAGAALDWLTCEGGEVRRLTLRWVQRRWLVLLVVVALALALLRLLSSLPEPFNIPDASSNQLGPISATGPNVFLVPDAARPPWLQLSLLLGAAVGAALVVLRPRRALWLLPLLQLADSASFNPRQLTPVHSWRTVLRSPAMARLQREPDSVGARLFMQPPWVGGPQSPSAGALTPNAPAIYGMASVQTYGAIQPAQYVKALELDHMAKVVNSLVAKAHVLSLVGTRFVALAAGDPQVRHLVGRTVPNTTRLVATMAADTPPANTVNVVTDREQLVLAPSPSGFALAERDIPCPPHRPHVLVVRASAPNGPPTKPLIVDLVTGDAALDGDRTLVVRPALLSPTPRTFHRVIDSAATPGAAKFRVLTQSARPIVVQRVEVHLRPLPAVKPAPSEQAPREVPLLQSLGRVDGLELLRNRAAFPRVWLTREAVPARDVEEAHLLRDLIPDLRHTVAMEGLTGKQQFQGGRAAVLQDSGDELRVRVHSKGPGVLVVADLHLPGWEARVNGKPAPLHRADGFLRAIPVPAGESTVVMTYHAPGLSAGLASFAITLALCLAALGWLWLRRQPPQVASGPGASAAAPRQTEVDDNAHDPTAPAADGAQEQD